MFIPTLTLNFSFRTRAVRNKDTDNNRSELNNVLHPAKSSGSAVGRAWDHILDRVETIRRKHWLGAQDESSVKLTKAATVSSPLETGPSQSDVSTQAFGPVLPFSPRLATVYALPSLASSGLTLPPTPGPFTPIKECSDEPDFGGKVKQANPDRDEENTLSGEGERAIAVRCQPPHFGRQPRMVTMRLGEWDVTSTRKCEANVNSETKPAINDNGDYDRRARLGCSSKMVTMVLGEFDMQWPRVRVDTGRQSRTVVMRLGEFDLARQWSRGLANGYDNGRDGSVGGGECKCIVSPARFGQVSPMVTMRLGEFDLAAGRMSS
ncbi:hypothetical protein EW145_g6493 [Phellinidium pouzarii]|uniref:Uncharacterized protein n=1 Tax=Phellinidium pouzarii TaxID=167371 RepID=A0A4S4KWI7_9AGAM|nr:hypothetical protein EW145_g6493 [Phellinidium pouzarii]